MTEKHDQRPRGRKRLRAASNARSPRTVVGRLTWRRRTATSWRRASNSTSFAPSDRHTKTTKPSKRHSPRYTSAQSPLRARSRRRIHRTVADQTTSQNCLINDPIEFSDTTSHMTKWTVTRKPQPQRQDTVVWWVSSLRPGRLHGIRSAGISSRTFHPVRLRRKR